MPFYTVAFVTTNSTAVLKSVSLVFAGALTEIGVIIISSSSSPPSSGEIANSIRSSDFHCGQQ